MNYLAFCIFSIVVLFNGAYATSPTKCFTKEETKEMQNECADIVSDYMLNEIEHYYEEGIFNFVDFCGNASIAIECFKNLTIAGFNPCNETVTHNSYDDFSKIFEAFVKHSCSNQEAHLRSFINDGGAECLVYRQEPIKECMGVLELSLTRNATNILPGNDKSKKFVIDEFACRGFAKIKDCIVNPLKKCPKPGPSIYVQELYNAIKEGTICSTIPDVPETSTPK